MKYMSPALLGLALAFSRLVTLPVRAYAAPICSGRVVCEHTLGIALTLPVGWKRLPLYKVAPHELDFERSAVRAEATRLVIRPFAITSLNGSAASARLVARKFAVSERGIRITQRIATYAGSPAVVLHGLLGPGPETSIVLGRGRYVYLIIAPGRTLASDQRVALVSLRFIPRVGPFLPLARAGR